MSDRDGIFTGDNPFDIARRWLDEAQALCPRPFVCIGGTLPLRIKRDAAKATAPSLAAIHVVPRVSAALGLHPQLVCRPGGWHVALWRRCAV